MHPDDEKLLDDVIRALQEHNERLTKSNEMVTRMASLIGKLAAQVDFIATRVERLEHGASQEQNPQGEAF